MRRLDFSMFYFILRIAVSLPSVFCFECHSTSYMDHNDLDEYGEPKKKPIKPMMYTDIATDHEYSSANTAHKKCEKALMKLKEAIKDLI